MSSNLVGTALICKEDGATDFNLNHAASYDVIDWDPNRNSVLVKGRYSTEWYSINRFYRSEDMGLADGEAYEKVVPPVNPKQVYGDKKPRLSLAPLSATLAQVEAQLDGLLKYGWVNWRENPVEAMTYLEAALRHLRLWENGEDYARDTLVDNLGAVMACCAIIIDARLHGTLIDNRKHSPQTCDLLHKRGEDMVRILQEKQKEREALKDLG